VRIFPGLSAPFRERARANTSPAAA
jgi:hypothetical protein